MTSNTPLSDAAAAALADAKPARPRHYAESLPDRGYDRRTDLDQRISDITAEWQQLDADNLKRAMDKAREYDGLDLEMMGRAMEALIPPGLDEQTMRSAGLEMAIAFYMLGKITRTFGSFRQGTIPTEDDYHDLEIYARMARIVRRHGRWT